MSAPLLPPKQSWPVEAWTPVVSGPKILAADPLSPVSCNHCCFVAESIILLKEAAAIREYCFHERVNVFKYVVHVQTKSTWMVGPRVSQQNIGQSITLPPLAGLLPIVHPGAMCSPGKQRTQPIHLMWKKTWFIRPDRLLPLSNQDWRLFYVPLPLIKSRL